MDDQIQFQLDCNLFCSTISEQLDEDPIGTATPHDRYIMLELSLPWSKPLIETRHFPQEAKERIEALQADGVKFRLMAFYADESPAPAGHHRLFCFSRPQGMITEYEKQEYIVPESLLPELITSLTTASGDMAMFSQYEVEHEHVRDLFVCTHGRHDVCCGKLGVPLYQTLSERNASRRHGNVRVWQVSHVGGHRFAPTMMDFPSGRIWANMKEQHLETLLNSEQMMPKLAKHYRGWSAIGLLEQVAERELWKHEGSKWVTYFKDASILEQKENGDAVVRFEYRSPDGTDVGAYRVYVKKVREITTIASCGVTETSVQPQYEVTKLEPIELASST